MASAGQIVIQVLQKTHLSLITYLLIIRKIQVLSGKSCQFQAADFCSLKNNLQIWVSGRINDLFKTYYKKLYNRKPVFNILILSSPVNS